MRSTALSAEGAPVKPAPLASGRAPSPLAREGGRQGRPDDGSRREARLPRRLANGGDFYGISKQPAAFMQATRLAARPLIRRPSADTPGSWPGGGRWPARGDGTVSAARPAARSIAGSAEERALLRLFAQAARRLGDRSR